MNINLDLLNLQNEQNASNMIVYFDDTFAYDIVEDHLARRASISVPELPNMCQIFKLQAALDIDPQDTEEMRIDKYNAYIQTIDTTLNLLLERNGLQKSDMYDEDNAIDLSIILYDFLICKFKRSIINIFINFILNNKEMILEAIESSDVNKKDISTIYGKKMYINHDIAIINANLDIALNIFMGLDISFNDIIMTLYPNGGIGQFVIQNVEECMPFFNIYKSIFTDERYMYVYMSDIKLELHQMSLVHQELQEVIS